jgi:hypothetical protein
MAGSTGKAGSGANGVTQFCFGAMTNGLARRAVGSLDLVEFVVTANDQRDQLASFSVNHQGLMVFNRQIEAFDQLRDGLAFGVSTRRSSSLGAATFPE